MLTKLFFVTATVVLFSQASFAGISCEHHNVTADTGRTLTVIYNSQSQLYDVKLVISSGGHSLASPSEKVMTYEVDGVSCKGDFGDYDFVCSKNIGGVIVSEATVLQVTNKDVSNFDDKEHGII